MPLNLRAGEARRTREWGDRSGFDAKTLHEGGCLVGTGAASSVVRQRLSYWFSGDALPVL